MEVCDMMIAVDGNRRMNALGRKMKCKLEGKKIVERVLVCKGSAFVGIDGTS